MKKTPIRKLKNPQVRVWTNPLKGGDAYFYAYRGTKTNLEKAKKVEKHNTNHRHVVVEYKGKEYLPSDFLKRHSKYRKKKR